MKNKFTVKDKHFEKEWYDYKNDYKDFYDEFKTKAESDSREIKYIQEMNVPKAIPNPGTV